MKLGYVRVSSKDQNTSRQDAIMAELGVEKVYTDKISGKNTDRPQLQEMMTFVREGDVIIVESISRFARNTKDLLELVEQLGIKNVQFISQKENIDTHTDIGKFLLTIFGAISELERDCIRQRQREGIDIAIAEGRYKGRPRKSVEQFDEVYSQWRSKKITAKKACKLLDVARSTFYRRVRQYEDELTVDF